MSSSQFSKSCFLIVFFSLLANKPNMDKSQLTDLKNMWVCFLFAFLYLLAFCLFFFDRIWVVLSHCETAPIKILRLWSTAVKHAGQVNWGFILLLKPQNLTQFGWVQCRLLCHLYSFCAISFYQSLKFIAEMRNRRKNVFRGKKAYFFSMEIKMMDLGMQIEGTKRIIIINYSVLDFFKFASRMPQNAQILVLTFKIFGEGMPSDPLEISSFISH